MKETYERKVFYSKEDSGWIAVIPELPGCSAFGKSPDKAFEELETAKDLWLEAAKQEKRRIPAKELHENLAHKAKEQGVSLNQFLLYIMAQYSHLGSKIARHHA